MTLFNYLFDNTDVLFFTFFLGTMTGAFIKATFFSTMEIPVTTIKTPTLYNLTRENLRELHSILDPRVDQGMQTISNIHSDVGIQASEVLTINTRNLNQVFIEQLDDFGIELREFAISSTEVSNKSAQTLINKLDQGTQTIDLQTSLNFIDKGVQTKPDLHLDILPMQGSIYENGLIVPPTVDLALVEAYVPFPELFNISNDILQYADLTSIFM
jgi:hypothetical protein